MYTLRRSCHKALQSRNALLLPTVSRRAFSQSPVTHRGSLPVFLPPSSPELSALLSTLNSKVLLPHHLTKDQQKLVFSKKSRARLEAEPIEITLGDVTLPLEHIDRTKDIPSKVNTWRAIIEQSKTPEDWENVIRMMEGFKNVGGIRPGWWEKIVRKLSENGMHHLILKCLQRPAATGLRMRERHVVEAVMRMVRDKAWMAGWEKDELVKALRMAEQVVELMEDKEHLGKIEGEENWRTHPMVVSVPLEMAAELAYRHEGDLTKVQKYAHRLMNSLKQRGYIDSTSPDLKALETLTAQTPDDFSSIPEQIKGIVNLSLTMMSHIPIWNSLSTARTVLDESMPMPVEAEQVQKALWAYIEKSLDTLEKLNVHKGKKLTPSKNWYPVYLKNAVEACQDDGEDVE